MAKRKRFWTTKYCLSDGCVTEKELEVSGEYGYIGTWQQYRIGRDAFPTKGEALRDALNRVSRKLASVDRQRQKLEDLHTKFDIQLTEPRDEE